MRSIIDWSIAVALAFIMTGTLARADDKDKAAPKEKLPKKVKEAVDGRFPGADLTSVEKENENGKVVYDIELKHKDRKYEMDISEDGVIIEIEKEVAAKDLPKAAIKVLNEKYPKATIKEIMEVNKVKDKKETPDHYEVVLVAADKKQMEVEVSLDGKTIKAAKTEEKK